MTSGTCADMVDRNSSMDEESVECTCMSVFCHTGALSCNADGVNLSDWWGPSLEHKVSTDATCVVSDVFSTTGGVGPLTHL